MKSLSVFLPETTGGFSSTMILKLWLENSPQQHMQHQRPLQHATPQRPDQQLIVGIEHQGNLQQQHYFRSRYTVAT